MNQLLEIVVNSAKSGAGAGVIAGIVGGVLGGFRVYRQFSRTTVETDSAVPAATADDSSTRVPESARTFLLSIYRLAVDYYQPKIEARTGVQLGSIEVWEQAKLRQRQIDDYKKTLGPLRSFLFSRRIHKFSVALETIDKERSGKIMACYYKNAIYVYFASAADHEDMVAEVVVHELAHALWDKLGGLNYGQPSHLSSKECDQHRLLSEGYATFAQNVWFRDIYPLHARIDVGYRTGDPDDIYGKGFKRVRQLVNEHGASLLMELPRRWREFATID